MTGLEKATTPHSAIAGIINKCVDNFSDWWARGLAVQRVRRHLEAITGDMVKEVLTIKFKNANIHVSDSWKEAPRWADFLAWLKVDSLSKMIWIKDAWDCDNYSIESKCRAERRIMGNISYGFVWYAKPAHAANGFVGYTDGVLKAIPVEPQSDSIPRYDPDEAYLVVM